MFFLIALFLILALVLIWISLDLDRQNDGQQPRGWGVGTRYFLVLLRLAIGWHFLVEGIDKYKSPIWSSEAYLRESTGPFASRFRSLAGDRLADSLTVPEDGSFPTPLALDWNNYVEAFKRHYELDDAQTQRATTNMEQMRSRTMTWLTSEKMTVSRPIAGGMTVTVSMTIPERIKDLKAKEAQVASIEDNDRPTFGSPAFAPLAAAKADAKRVRADLQAELALQTTAMKKALYDVLSAEQKKQPGVTEPVGRSLFQWGRREWTDKTVKFGLIAVGIGLLAGALTRTACIGGAVLLFLFYLAMPPLPGWPESPRAEGHYILINKNIIEMLALLVLATTRSGRWAGLDGLLQFLKPRYWRQTPSQVSEPNYATAAEPASRPTASDIAAGPSKEKLHGP